MQRLAAVVEKYSLQEHSPDTVGEEPYSPDIAEEEHKELRSCRSAWMWLLCLSSASMWLLSRRKTLSSDSEPAEVAPTERAFEGTIYLIGSRTLVS